jgi:hypothetical protein
MTGFLCAVLKVMSYRFVNIFSANKVATLYPVDLLYYVCLFVCLFFITETIQVTGAHMLASLGLVYQNR